MARKISFAETLEDGARLKALWETMPKLEIGEFSLKDFAVIFDTARALMDDYTKKKAELAGIKHTRDDTFRDLSNLITRFRSSVRANFGPDSVEYTRAGGTRS